MQACRPTSTFGNKSAHQKIYASAHYLYSVSTKNILITGGTGFLGSHLKKILAEKNYRVAVLSRSRMSSENSFQWNVENKFIDPKALEETDTIIHLAGASLAEDRWTERRKKVIIDSRVKSAELLFEKLKNTSHHVTTFISASGIGFYGETHDQWVDESSAAGNDFPPQVCIAWEDAVKKIASLGIRVVIIRIGFVLAKDGGALPVLSKPVRWFIGSPLGSGKQFLSWIHVDDVCSIFLKALEDEKMNGVFNAVATNPVTQKEFMLALASNLRRILLPIHVPAWFLKMLLGEKSVLVLSGQRVSNKKLLDSGFQFQYLKLEDALSDIG